MEKIKQQLTCSTDLKLISKSKVLTIPNYPEDKYMYGDKLNVTNNKK